MIAAASLAAAATAAVEGAEHAKSGLPQLDFTTWPSQIFWLCVAVGGLYWLMTRVALPQIEGTLADRADAIADDLDTAERFRTKAKAVEETYATGLAQARAEAAAIGAATKAAIQAELDAALAQAATEITARTEAASARIAQIGADAAAGIDEIATATATAIVEALLPQALDQGAVGAAVQSRL